MYRIKNILVRIHIQVLYLLYKIHIWVRYPHDLAFRKRGWYYRWHSKPYANLSHWLFFIAYKVFIISLTLAFVLSPPYQGLYAATSNWDFGGGANGTGDSNIVNPSSTLKLKPDWYYTDYQKRQLLTVNATDAVSSGYSVKTDLDLAGMVNSSLLRPDLNDLRIGAYDRTDGRFETVAGAEDTSKTGLDRDVIKGQGLNLNGSSQWIDAGNNSSLDLGTGNFTIEGWIYARGGSGNDFILSKDSGTSNTHIAINVNTTNGKIGGWVGGSSFTGTTNVLNSWAHFALVRSGGNLNLYVNGNSDMTPISNSGNVNTTRNLIIGAYVDSLGNIEQHFNGQIDELRWSNTGFYSSNFILQRTPFVPDSNTKGLWHLDNDAGDSAAGNNGTLNGSPYFTEGKVIKGVGTSQISGGESGLKGLWRMNNDWTDHSGNGYAGTRSGTGTAFSTSAKLGSHAGQFNGTDDYVTLPSNIAPAPFWKSRDRTIEAWIKPNSASLSGTHEFFTAYDTASYDYARLWLSLTGGKVRFLYSIYPGPTYISIYSNNTLTADTWYHVAVTWDSNTYYLYINGVLQGTYSHSAVTADNVGLTTVGADIDGQELRYFGGLIDEVAIYNRALSASEVAERYNAKSEVWFKTLSDIGAGSNSEVQGAGGQHSYYAYYNYASAGSPPENKDNVYLFNDDFPGSSIDVSKWPTRSGTTSVSNGELSIAANPPTESYVSTASNYGTNTEFIAMVRSSATAAYSSAGYGPFSDPSTKWFNNSGTLKFRTYQTVATETTVPDISTSYKELRINRNSTTNAKLYWDNTLQATHTTNLATGNLGVGFYVWSAAHNLYVDWIKVRSYTANEPTISNGTETDKGTSNAYLTPGYWTSNNIGHANLYDWGTLTVTKTTPGASTLTVDVLRASDSAVLATNVATGTDLNVAGVSNAEKSIKLRANLAGGADSPTLSALSLGYSYETDPPTNPTNLSASAASATSNSLTWTASTDTESGIAGYKIERAPDSSGSPGTFAQIGTSATASWTDNSTNNPTSPPVANTKYWYRVRAYDNAGNNSNYNDYTSANIYAGVGDGDIWRVSEPSWSQARSDPADGADYTSSQQYLTYEAQPSSGVFHLYRGWFAFDTSPIPDGATIGNATLNFNVYGVAGSPSPSLALVSGTQASTSQLTTSDYQAFGSTELASRITVSANGWSAFTLNSSGLSSISKTSFSKYAVRGSHDIDNSAPAVGSTKYVAIYWNEWTGTSLDPFMTVYYSTPVSARTLANVPTSPSASAASTSSINVSWASGGAQDHYHVKSSLDSYASNIYNSTGTSTPQNGLSANIQYTYRIYGVNADDVESSTYASASKYTLANTPGAPTVSDATTTSLKVVIDQNSNPSNTTYAIYNNAATQYVQANGSLGAGAVYQTYTAWGGATGIVNTSLTPETSYTYKVLARNGDNTDTAFGPISAALSTLPDVPNPPTMGTPTALSPTSIRWNFTDTATNEIGFKLHDATHTTVVTDANPNLTYIDETGLSTNTQYTRHIHAYNGTGDSAASASSSKYTQANVPGAPTVNTPAAATLKVTINQNSNPAGTGYAIYETATAKYVQADGTLGVSAVWQDYTAWGGVSGITVTGLTANKQYTFQVKARNGDLEETSLSGSTSLYTRPLDAAITSVKSTGTWYNTSNFDFTNANSWDDGGVQYYRYFWTQSFTHIWDNTEPTWSNLNANCPGGICSVANTTLSLTTTADGNWYLYLKAFNGNDQAQAGTPANYGAFMYDGSLPLSGSVSDSNFGDIDWVNSTNQLSGNWSGFTDALSGIASYEYSIGTTPGAENVSGWTNVGTSTNVTRSGLSLSEGQIYYFNARAYDNAGNVSGIVSSDGQTVDTTGPVTGGASMNDGTSSDIAWIVSLTQLSANWSGFTDAGSGIANYEYMIGTTQNSGNIVGWTQTVSTSVTKTGLTLSEGQIYYFTVRAIDNVNNVSVSLFSNGQTVDSVSPATSVTLDPSSPNGQNGWYTSVPTVTLSGTDAVSGIQTTYFSWDSNNGPWTAYSGPLIPQDGNQTLYFYSSDNASNSETVKSQNIKTDSQAPSIPQGLSASTVSTSQINLSWSASSDAASGIYRYIVYSSTDNITFNQIVTTSSSSYQDTGLSENTTYYYKIKTQDNAGNQSGFSASASAKTNATSSPPPQDNQESSTDDQSGQQQSLPSTAPTSSPKPKVEVGAPVKPETVVIKGKQGELNIPITVNENLEIKVLAELVKKVQIKVELASAVEAKAIISDQEFGLQNTSGDIWEGEVSLPEEPGTYAIKVKSKKADGQIVEQQVLTVLIDPSGYVFDKAKKTKIVNAVVLLLEKQGENFNSWDAKKYGQENPQKTNNAGEYGFMVPKGTYIVKAEAPGYKLYISDEVVVKDEPITLNIPLEAESLKKYDQNKTIILISTIGLVILGMIIFRVKKNA